MHRDRTTTTSSGIGAFRDAAFAVRTIAMIVLITFGWLIASPAVAAMRDYSPPAAPPTPSAEQHLAHVLRKASHKVAKTQARVSAQEMTSSNAGGIKHLRNEVSDLNAAVLSNFRSVNQLIKKKHLPKVIRQRQTNVIERYKKSMATILDKLDAALAAKNQADRATQMKAVHKLLNGMKFGRSHQPYNPNNLNPSFKTHKKHKPKTLKKQFIQAGLYRKTHVMLAALSDFKFDGLPGASNPAYLAQTPEVKLSQAIKDQAVALDHDPVKIYDWVRNHVQWTPTWGAFQSSDMTLSTRRGNAMDIASLTIALLRASGIPSRYVYGTIEVPVDKFINWVGDFDTVAAAQNYASVGGIATAAVTTGGKITKMRMGHIWVEAAIDYHPSRGARNISADSWIAMDPSFKQYDYKQGLDVTAVTGIDGQALSDAFEQSGTVNQSEGWVQGLDPSVIQNAQQQAQQKLSDYIDNNLTDPTVGDIIGGRRTIIKEYPDLPSSLPYHIVIAGQRYAELPDGLRNFMSFAFGKDILGQPNEPIRLPWAAVNNEPITLSFRPATDADEQALLALLPDGGVTDPSQLPSSIPAYLVKVVPELKLNG